MRYQRHMKAFQLQVDYEWENEVILVLFMRGMRMVAVVDDFDDALIDP